MHEPVRDVAAGDLGPGQRHRQARLARAGLARQHDHRVRPGGLDQLIQLGRGLEILGLLQDLGAARAVLPEDLAGVAREIPREGEAGIVRVVGDVLRRAIPLREEPVDVPAVELRPRPRGRPAPTAR